MDYPHVPLNYSSLHTVGFFGIITDIINELREKFSI